MENKYESKRMYWANLTYFIILLLFTLLRLSNALGLLKFLPAQISDYAFPWYPLPNYKAWLPAFQRPLVFFPDAS